MHKTIDTQSTHVQIEVQNFGPIEKASIELRPLNVFVGESNTGKTYLAALIYALHKNFEGFSRFPCSNTFAHTLGPRYRSETINSLMRQLFEAEMSEALRKLNAPEHTFKYSDIPQRIRRQWEMIFTNDRNFEDELKRCFDIESVSKLIRFNGNNGNEMRISLQVCEENQNYWNFEAQDSGSGINLNVQVNPDLVLRSMNAEALHETLDIQDLLELLSVYMQDVSDAYYLPAARSGIMQSHAVITSSLIKRSTRIGLDRYPEMPTFSGMLADFLERIVEYSEHGEPTNEMIHISKTLENEVLRGGIEVERPMPYTYPNFLYRPSQTGHPISMSRVSSMISELAPLVLFLRGIVCPGDLLIIEEPESHLHPDAQTKIAYTLARLVRAGVRIVITTHSDWLLQQIGNLIREGELRKHGKIIGESADWLLKEEVGTWWFHPDKPVEKLPFDRIGGIEPSDYEDVADRLYNTFAELEQKFLEKEVEDANE